MGWFWADSEVSTNSGKCPVDHRAFARQSQSSGACPVKHDSVSSCPVKGKDGEILNPLNNMPLNISSDKAPGQKITLPTERTFSTIPRGKEESEGVWEYPSPQQMLNAMLRKGKGDIPEDAVESMVDVHNFLNEGAWQEILEWENKYSQETKTAPRLLKFTGRPHDLSPRARMYLQLGKFFPETFNTEPPFDRHDWTVLRSDGNGDWREVRYVIDYYGGPDDFHGMPTFMLDVRPALDNPTNAIDRLEHWSKPLWDKALGRVSPADD